MLIFLSDLIDENKKFMSDLDNLAFLQNAIEVLAGEVDFVRLRNRRPVPRTLKAIEEKVEQFRAERLKAQQAVDKEIDDELKDAQKKLDKVTDEIADTEMDFISKLQATSQQAQIAQRKFELKKKRLERERDEKISGLKAREQPRNRQDQKYRLVLVDWPGADPSIVVGDLCIPLSRIE